MSNRFSGLYVAVDFDGTGSTTPQELKERLSRLGIEIRGEVFDSMVPAMARPGDAMLRLDDFFTALEAMVEGLDRLMQIGWKELQEQIWNYQMLIQHQLLMPDHNFIFIHIFHLESFLQSVCCACRLYRTFVESIVDLLCAFVE